MVMPRFDYDWNLFQKAALLQPLIKCGNNGSCTREQAVLATLRVSPIT